jgi:two-component system cell cycle response regulator
MGPKILTVDDSKTIRMIVARAFRSFACEIFEASDGVEGLAVVKREKPDIIILDFTMPIMDGVEMLTKLKSDPDSRGIPVVMLTAESGRENVLRIAKLGVRDYLIKPFKEDLIIERVGRIIDLKARTDVQAKAKRYDDPLHILVVDDKPAIHEQIAAGFADTKWTVQGLSQAGQAVDYCSQRLPDVIMVSLTLPENSGYMLFQMFRASIKTKSLPILAMTVKTATDEQTRAQQFGFTSIVTKPIDIEDLKHKITRALGLDTSYRYFERRDGKLVLRLPAAFSPAVANDINAHLRAKVCEAVDSGLNRLIIDMSQLRTADVNLIKLGLSTITLCQELDMKYTLVGSEAVCGECKNYEETKDWQFVASFEEALGGPNGKIPSLV